MESELKSFWSNIFTFDWKFGLFLIFLICTPRFVLVLHANETANYGYIGMIMIISAILPFVFLSKYGRKKIGIKIPTNNRWLIIGFTIGIVFSVSLYFLGEILYGNSYDNWYSYIGKSYTIPEGIDQQSKLALFGIMAITGITFSPIGEELFFRGIVHSSFAKSMGDRKASIIDSFAFAIVHISHFGLIFINQQWKFLLAPTLIWVLSMLLVSMFFYICRQRSGSILGAIVCHSAFNLGMIYCIFYPISGN